MIPSVETCGRSERDGEFMTNAHLFFVVRYSILNGEPGSWKITRQDWAAYREQLFDPARLKQRFRLFSGLTLPSLTAQRFDRNVSVSLIVITAAELPSAASAELRDGVGNLPEWLDADVLPVEADGASVGALVQTAVNNSLRERYGDHDVDYATVRLDDDDLLSNRYVEKISRYTRPEFSDMVVSFPRGFIGMVGAGSGRVEDLRHYYAPKVALGMAHVGAWRNGKTVSRSGNVFSVGNHAEIGSKAPVILDGSFDAFIRTFHGDNDSGADVTQKEWIMELPKAGSEVRKSFPEQCLARFSEKDSEESREEAVSQKACQQEIAKLRACRRRRNKLRRKLDEKHGSRGRWKVFR